MIGLPLIAFLPLAAFLALAIAERASPRAQAWPVYSASDWALNLIGLGMQGLIVPLAGFALATLLLQPMLPQAAGVLPLGFWGAFLLNVAAVDFLYYWNHRLMHRAGPLWRLHLCHHASPRLDVWATSRNAVAANFLFVYVLVNPWLGFLCDAPEGFFAGAMLTAALDVWRHTSLREPRAFRPLSWLLITPAAHHRHHDADAPPANFGANLSLWDRLFGTYAAPQGRPARYRTGEAGEPLNQLFYPFVPAAPAPAPVERPA